MGESSQGSVLFSMGPFTCTQLTSTMQLCKTMDTLSRKMHSVFFDGAKIDFLHVRSDDSLCRKTTFLFCFLCTEYSQSLGDFTSNVCTKIVASFRFNNATGIFTVPIGGAGLYIFSTYLMVPPGETAVFYLNVNNTDQGVCFAVGDHDNIGNDYSQAACTGLAELQDGRFLSPERQVFNFHCRNSHLNDVDSGVPFLHLNWVLFDKWFVLLNCAFHGRRWSHGGACSMGRPDTCAGQWLLWLHGQQNLNLKTILNHFVLCEKRYIRVFDTN